MTKTSRLGEAISPERDFGLLKTHKTLPGWEVALNMRNSNTISPRRASLTWARVRVAQTQSTSLERDALLATRFASLLISPRRAWLVWAKIAGPYIDYARNNSHPIPISIPIHIRLVYTYFNNIYAQFKPHLVPKTPSTHCYIISNA